MIEWIVMHAPDDAFLYLQLAKDKAYYLTTNGFQPLWGYLVTLLGFTAQGNALVYVVAGVYWALLVATPFVIRKLYHTWWGFTVWVIPALWVGNIGMELTLATLLIFVAMKKRNGWWASLMVYARLDLILLAVLITPWRKWWKIVLCMAPYIIFNLVVFHTIIPDSMAHSWSGDVNRFTWPITIVNYYYIAWPLIIVSMIGCWKKYKVLLIEFAFLLLLDVIKNSSYAWHYTVIAPIIVFGCWEIWKWVKSRDLIKEFSRNTSKVLTGVGILILAFLIVPSWTTTLGRDDSVWNQAWYEARTIQVDGTRGAFNAGIQGYFSNQPVVDIGGYFAHQVVMPEYFTDYSIFAPTGYTLVKSYPNEVCPGNGVFGVYKRNK